MKRERGFYLGVATAAVIVLGLLVLRTVFTSGYSLAAEFLSNRLTYIYVFIATAVVFMALGYVLGRQADELRRLSMTDALTGLSNRQAFHARLREEWRRSRADIARRSRCCSSTSMISSTSTTSRDTKPVTASSVT